MENTSDYLVERLYDWGIRRVYGYPGDGINGVMGALNRHRDKIKFIQARHGEEAAFMACGHAKFSGEVGVCISTSGPGAIHLLNGLYDAKMDHQPVVAIVGQQATRALGTDFQQEVDLISLYKDVAHEFVHMASTPAQVRQLVDRAVRIAKAERTVTAVIFPNDVQEMEAVPSPPRKHGSSYTGIGYLEPATIPQEKDLQQAANLLNQATRVAMLVGAGALNASEEVALTAEALGAGVAKALLGKAVLPDNLPYVTGAIGLLGTKPSYEMMEECDALLVVGSTFPYSEFYPKEGQARGVQIDIRPRALSLRYPMDCNLVGDAALTLRALLPHLKPKTMHGWRNRIEKNVADWWKVLESRAMHNAKPINPQRLFWELSPLLPDHCILTCDSGSAANWYARDLKIRHGMMASLSGGLMTMCPGVPYATAAKFCHPEWPVVAMVGDGAMQMLGNDGLLTIGKFWKEWSNPTLVILVLHNNDLNQVTWEQRVFSGDPKFQASQDIPNFPYAAYAELAGLRGIGVKEPSEIKEAFVTAFREQRPVVIDALCDPDVPPLPPHLTLEQVRSYTSSILAGDPNVRGVITQSVKEMVSTILPRTGKQS